MKILAIERELPDLAEDDFTPHLRAEALQAWRLVQDGAIRELYFRADRDEAVLVLECADLESARRIIETLPLVRERLIDFDLIPLRAYPGFSRLFAEVS
jgi:hypothetical protein